MLVLQMSLMPDADTEPISCGTARSLFDLRFSHQLSSEYTILGDLHYTPTSLRHLHLSIQVLSPAS